MSGIEHHNMLCAVENFAHQAAEMGWNAAAAAVDEHRRSPPEGDQWTEDYERALRGIASAFRAAARKLPEGDRRR